MSSWWVDPSLSAGAGRALGGLEAAFALDGEQVSWSPLCRVLRVSFAGACYYAKLYVGERSGWLRSGFGLRSRLVTPPVRREWENLQAFRSWGIPTARLVAYGQERRLGRFVRGALITEALADAVSLAFIDCPVGRRWWGPALTYRKIKGLACLDKTARHQLSRTRRLRFYPDYAQRPRLDTADRKVLTKVLKFFAGRE